MYKVRVSNDGTTKFNVETGNYEFIIDSEGNNGITPPDTLLASLASCMGVYIRKYCKNTNLDIKHFEIILKAELSIEKPIRFKEIHARIDFKGQIVDEMRQRSIIAFLKNCPVHNTLQNQPKIETEVI